MTVVNGTTVQPQTVVGSEPAVSTVGDGEVAPPAEAAAPVPVTLPPPPDQVTTDDEITVAADKVQIINSTDNEVTYQVRKPNSRIVTVTLASHATNEFSMDDKLFIRFYNDEERHLYTLAAGSCNQFVADDDGNVDMVWLVTN